MSSVASKFIRIPKIYVDDDVEGLLDLLTRHPSEDLEDDTIEFKEYRDEQALHGAKDLAEEISALANWRGGMIVIGVRDSSSISDNNWRTQLVGFPAVDPVEVKQRLLGRLRPAIDLRATNIRRDGQSFLVIRVPHRRDTLVATSSGKYCIREGRSSRPMLPDEIQAAVKAQVAYDWTSDPLEVDVGEALDPEAVVGAVKDFADQRKISESFDRDRYLEAIGATSNGLLTKGGLLFLGTESAIRRYLGEFEFRFSWKTPGGALVVNDVWQGCLWNAVRRATRRFSESNDDFSFQHRGRRYKVPILDRTAFHEAYLNALVHRDYSIEGMVTVNYTGEQLSITSPGSFYGGITADNIGYHEPRHRNKTLAKIMMSHHLVDRAGMGVVRMSLVSLRYGRRLPSFREVLNSVEVTMDAGDFLRPAIFVLTTTNPDRYGTPELIVLNRVCDTGCSAVPDLLRQLRWLGKDNWDALTKSVANIEGMEFCGTKEGVFVRVSKKWVKYFGVGREFKIPSTSDNYVRLYTFLKKHGSASNSEITSLLNYSHSSQTSRFLRDAEFVERTGNGRSAQWSIREGC